jgi:hypothetical protein
LAIIGVFELLTGAEAISYRDVRVASRCCTGNWRQDAASTGTLEASRYVAAAILAASDGGFQPQVPHP